MNRRSIDLVFARNDEFSFLRHLLLSVAFLLRPLLSWRICRFCARSRAISSCNRSQYLDLEPGIISNRNHTCTASGSLPFFSRSKIIISLSVRFRGCAPSSLARFYFAYLHLFKCVSSSILLLSSHSSSIDDPSSCVNSLIFNCDIIHDVYYAPVKP